MKNFSMPKQISETLEQDELLRLKRGLEASVPKEAAARILAKLPPPAGSSPKDRAQWVDNVSALLEKSFDAATVKAIREKCYCNENGRLEATADYLRELYLSQDKDLRRFVDAVNETGACWYIKDGQLYTKMFSCECPMLEKAKNTHSLTWCHCTAGYNKKLFETVFGAPVDAQIIQSIRQGFDFCLLRISIQ